MSSPSRRPETTESRDRLEGGDLRDLNRALAFCLGLAD